MPSATIKIFLVHADPKRLRTAELSNWTGKAVAGPRSEFEHVLAREESTSSGIYFLTGNIFKPKRGGSRNSWRFCQWTDRLEKPAGKKPERARILVAHQPVFPSITS